MMLRLCLSDLMYERVDQGSALKPAEAAERIKLDMRLIRVGIMEAQQSGGGHRRAVGRLDMSEVTLIDSAPAMDRKRKAKLRKAKRVFHRGTPLAPRLSLIQKRPRRLPITKCHRVLPKRAALVEYSDRDGCRGSQRCSRPRGGEGCAERKSISRHVGRCQLHRP